MKGTLRWYIHRADPKALSFFIERMGWSGITTRNPATGTSIMLGETGRVSVDPATIPWFLTESQEAMTTCLLWLDANINVAVSLYRDRIPVVEIDLDGLTGEQAFHVASAALLVAVTAPDSIALLGDLNMEDQSDEWDAFIGGEGPPPATAPAIHWRRGTGAQDALHVDRSSWFLR